MRLGPNFVRIGPKLVVKLWSTTQISINFGPIRNYLGPIRTQYGPISTKLGPSCIFGQSDSSKTVLIFYSVEGPLGYKYYLLTLSSYYFIVKL